MKSTARSDLSMTDLRKFETVGTTDRIALIKVQGEGSNGGRVGYKRDTRRGGRSDERGFTGGREGWGCQGGRREGTEGRSIIDG